MFSILTEPLSSFWTFTCFENIKKRACRTNIASHEQALQEGESVPPSVEETIRSFIRDVCRLDSTNIAIRASEESSLPSTRGSLVYGNRPIIYIPLRYVKQITEEFTSSHQFAIAHECGHLAFDDWCVGMIQQEKAAALARLCGYGVTVALASQVFFFVASSPSYGMHRRKNLPHHCHQPVRSNDRTTRRSLCCRAF